MWASARAELLRPGLSGGGGGRPLWLTGFGTAAKGTGAATGAATLAGFSGFADVAGFLLVTGNGLAVAAMTLTGLTATFAAGFVTTLAFTLAGATGAFGTALAVVLDVGLIVAFGAALALADFEGTGLAADWTTGFFKATLGLATGFAIFLGTGLGAAFGRTFTGILDFAAALRPTVLATVWILLAGLLALADFAGFAFTACLLLEAASG